MRVLYKLYRTRPFSTSRLAAKVPPFFHSARRGRAPCCGGVRVEAIADPLLREIRYLDKLVDELAKGRPLEKILRQG